MRWNSGLSHSILATLSPPELTKLKLGLATIHYDKSRFCCDLEVEQNLGEAIINLFKLLTEVKDDNFFLQMGFFNSVILSDHGSISNEKYTNED